MSMCVAKALSVGAVMSLAGLAQAGVVYLDPGFGVTATTYRMQARYRVSNTNWDQYIGTSPFVAPANIVQQRDLGGQSFLNNRVWDFNLTYAAGSGYTFTLTNGNTVQTVGFNAPHSSGSPTASFNAMELYVQAGDSMPAGITSAQVRAYDLNLSFTGSSPTLVGSLRDMQDSWTNASPDSGLDEQAIFADFDLSQTTWSLTGKVVASYVGTPTSGNFDERLKFNLKTFEAIPTPGAVTLAGVAGLALARRRRA